MESPSGLKILLVYAVLLGGIAFLARFPRLRVAKFFRAQVGPSTRVEVMTRGEAFESARGFLTIALVCTLIAYTAVTLGDRLYGQFDRSQTFMALMFMASIGMMMGVGGALALGVRGRFRPKELYRWHEDPLSRTEFVKEYRSSDLRRSVIVVQHPEGRFEVVTPAPLPPEAKIGITPRAFAWGMLRSLGVTNTLEEAERLALEASGHLPPSTPPGDQALPPAPAPY